MHFGQDGWYFSRPFAQALLLRAVAHFAVVDLAGLALVVDVDHVRGAHLAIGALLAGVIEMTLATSSGMPYS
jgi:hypothetical protein